jgi:hypothetical protein
MLHRPLFYRCSRRCLIRYVFTNTTWTWNLDLHQLMYLMTTTCANQGSSEFRHYSALYYIHVWSTVAATRQITAQYLMCVNWKSGGSQALVGFWNSDALIDFIYLCHSCFAALKKRKWNRKRSPTLFCFPWIDPRKFSQVRCVFFIHLSSVSPKNKVGWVWARRFPVPAPHIDN